MSGKHVARLGVSVPAELLEQFDRFVKQKGYGTRSRAIADLMRESLMREEWTRGSTEVIGAVTLLYDHHTRGLGQRMTQLQHDHHETIVSTTHIHVDHHRCLEIVILRGKVARVQQLGDRLIGLRGVLHGKIVLAATGQAS